MTCFVSPTSIFAAGTGSLKVFSEVKDIQIFVDEILVGTDRVEMSAIESGQHYVKAVQNGVIIYSELVSVPTGESTTILVKATQQSQKVVLDAKYKEQQEYKRKKLDILLSKSFQTQGSSSTYSDYFPGYYSIFGMGWTKSSSTTYETTDWKIIQGGIQEISDLQFAQLVGDKGSLTRVEQTNRQYEEMSGTGAIVSLVGLVATIAGFSSALASPNPDSGLIICTFGIIGTIAGLGMISATPPVGHLVSPATAAEQADGFNQLLKNTLGLPESYEP
ncbi:MAG: hypothetical protein A2Y40_01675 [Candidatus Margulisbacteria bacterium GWF2_35_9]|nr:MAG: hypothetical protein A2Y40_01675 [Candidatus Margulisbacteria bacterium GWF2_35_9]